jgi:hypothetical protein
MTGSQLPLCDTPPAMREPSTRWREIAGHESDIVSRLGRLNDLVVIARPVTAPAASSFMALEAALFDASAAENLRQTESRFAGPNEGLFQQDRPNANVQPRRIAQFAVCYHPIRRDYVQAIGHHIRAAPRSPRFHKIMPKFEWTKTVHAELRTRCRSRPRCPQRITLRSSAWGRGGRAHAQDHAGSQNCAHGEGARSLRSA